MIGWLKQKFTGRITSICTHPRSGQDQRDGKDWPDSKRVQEANVIFRTLLEVANREFQIRWDNPQLFKNTHGADWQVETVNMSDFERVRTLGTGAFGRVLLVRRRRVSIRSSSGGKQEYYALKLIEKSKVVRMANVAHTVNERRVLAAVRHPFLVELLAHFKDSTYVYMLLEYVAGGELFGLLQKRGRLEESLARFYVAQLVLAFEYLHSVGVVYRDLCAENVLIDSRGYIKLTDFGFAKLLREGTTSTFCGTIEYLAPEMVNRKGHGYGVDWWALGVLLFEMIAGFVPFSGDDQASIVERIATSSPDYPAEFSVELRELLAGLLEHDTSKRLGRLEDGLIDVRKQRWLAGVDWIAVYKRDLDPLYIPKLSHAGDASYFEMYDEEPLNFTDEDLFASEFSNF